MWRNWRRQRWLSTHRLPDCAWQAATSRITLLDGLTTEEQARLRDLTSLFLREKTFEGAHGLQVTETMRLVISMQACLPILNLGLDYYDGWVEMLVYPGGFRARHEFHDEAGVVHVEDREMTGEAWSRGPVILSWEDIREDLDHPGHGYNVVIHEMAHKLDMLNSDANGFPPLHRGMVPARWADAFSTAYQTLASAVDEGVESLLDPYAASSPEEFFAVASEAFFDAPRILAEGFPGVYEQLRLFYRQDTLRRGRQRCHP